MKFKILFFINLCFLFSLAKSQKNNFYDKDNSAKILLELNLSEEKKEIFHSIYQNYRAEHYRIKKSFKPSIDVWKLSSAEAEKEIEKGFLVGQELLDNRKKFAKEAGKILSPQQILRIFHLEGKNRYNKCKEKEFDKKNP